jgi:hypothetical protein
MSEHEKKNVGKVALSAEFLYFSHAEGFELISVSTFTLEFLPLKCRQFSCN